MDLMDFGTVQEGKMRLVQEMVPGKQVTLAHIIASPVEMGFIDRFSGTLIFTGRISNVQAAVSSILTYLKNHLGFTICEITRT